MSPLAETVFTYDIPDASCNGSAALGAGRVTRMTDASGSTNWCYDIRGRQVKATHLVLDVFCSTQRTFTMQAAYDSANRRTSLTYPDGEIVNYTYNDTPSGGGVLTGMRSTAGPGSGSTCLGYVGYGSPSGQPTAMYVGGVGGSAAGGPSLVTGYAYDGLYRLQNTTSGIGLSTVQNLTFGYYDNGNVKEVKDTAHGPTDVVAERRRRAVLRLRRHAPAEHVAVGVRRQNRTTVTLAHRGQAVERCWCYTQSL